MSQVISATAKFNRPALKREEFLGKARILLAEAKKAQTKGQADLALEYAYQAALRTAGARIATSKVAGRARKPKSAWDQLRLVDEEGVAQAEKFSAYSRIRSRVASGVEFGIDEGVVRRLIDEVQVFIYEVEGGAEFLSVAA